MHGGWNTIKRSTFKVDDKQNTTNNLRNQSDTQTALIVIDERRNFK